MIGSLNLSNKNQLNQRHFSDRSSNGTLNWDLVTGFQFEKNVATIINDGILRQAIEYLLEFGISWQASEFEIITRQQHTFLLHVGAVFSFLHLIFWIYQAKQFSHFPLLQLRQRENCAERERQPRKQTVNVNRIAVLRIHAHRIRAAPMLLDFALTRIGDPDLL